MATYLPVAWGNAHDCVLLIAATSSPAFAHTGTDVVGGFSAGFTHPIFGYDHLLAMLAVGLWGAQIGGWALWELPVTFPLVMAIGGPWALPACRCHRSRF